MEMRFKFLHTGQIIPSITISCFIVSQIFVSKVNSHPKKLLVNYNQVNLTDRRCLLLNLIVGLITT